MQLLARPLVDELVEFCYLLPETIVDNDQQQGPLNFHSISVHLHPRTEMCGTKLALGVKLELPI